MHWWKTYDRFFFSPPSLFHVSDSEIVSGDNFFDALDNGVVVCRLARVIQEKARTAIDAGRAKGVSNSFSLSASTFENWMRINIDRNVEVQFYLVFFSLWVYFLTYFPYSCIVLLIIVINSIENWKQFIWKQNIIMTIVSLSIFLFYRKTIFFSTSIVFRNINILLIIVLGYWNACRTFLKRY